MPLLGQGLIISLAGLTLTFAALGMLILIIIALEKLFPVRAIGGNEPAREGAASIESGDDINSEIAAAIAVALAVLQRGENDRNVLGGTLTAGRGRWWDPGVARDHPAVLRGRHGE